MPVTAGAQLLNAPSNACSGAGHGLAVPLAGLLFVMSALLIVIIT